MRGASAGKGDQAYVAHNKQRILRGPVSLELAGAANGVAFSGVPGPWSRGA